MKFLDRKMGPAAAQTRSQDAEMVRLGKFWPKVVKPVASRANTPMQERETGAFREFTVANWRRRMDQIYFMVLNIGIS
jgi:hypothetical protein